MLTKYRPSDLWSCGPFVEFQDEVSRFLGDAWGIAGRSVPLGYRVDVREDADHVYIEAELPGLTKEDIEITLEDGLLTIAGEKKFEREGQEENFHLRERRFGRFCRTFQLSSVVDEQKVHANLKEGVLLVTLDKREEIKPKRIEVQVG